MSHTPGPWRVRYWSAEDPLPDDLPNLIEGAIKNADFHDWHGRWVCTFPDLRPEFRTEQRANARLIAAAPELLDALKDAVLQIEYLHDKFQHTSSGEAAIVRAQIAIAKAEGK